MTGSAEIKVFSGEKSTYIAQDIAKALGVNLGERSLLRFSDGEFVTAYNETVRGDYVFIVPPCHRVIT